MQQRDLKVYRGDDVRFQISILRPDGTNPYKDNPLTAAEVAMLVRPAYQEPFRPKIEVQGARVVVTFSADATRFLQWSKADYDLQITRGGVTKTVLRGKVILERDVTP